MNSKVLQRLEAYLIQDNGLVELEIKEHSERVEKYARLIAENSDTKIDINLVGLCGRYHDIGKCFINIYYPDVLPTKHFKEFEKEAIKQHTLMGVELLNEAMLKEGVATSGNNEYEKLFDAILFHHENLDGTGYHHLTNIPEIAQIIAVADRFSAGIEERLYHEPKPPEVVIAEMQTAQESQLNQKYVEALQRGIVNGRDKEIQTGSCRTALTAQQQDSR